MSKFDRIAPYYDFLARLVFGRSIVNAQEYFLSKIREGDRILILGGGTGWILESIFKITRLVEIWYIESSPKMIEKSAARNVDASKVHFICGTVDDIPPNLKFDVVITNFFLDVFPASELEILIGDIKAKLNSQGIWLCTDFVNTNNWFQKSMLKFMYLFFRIVAGLTNRSLPDWEGCIHEKGVPNKKEKLFWNGFIKSTVFSIK